MKTTHTPGPWRIGDAGLTIFGPPNGNPSPETIAHVNKRQNAPLLRAAPDLLAALESLFEHCAMIHNRWGEGCNSNQADAAQKAGRAAIAKARGES